MFFLSILLLMFLIFFSSFVFLLFQLSRFFFLFVWFLFCSCCFCFHSVYSGNILDTALAFPPLKSSLGILFSLNLPRYFLFFFPIRVNVLQGFNACSKIKDFQNPFTPVVISNNISWHL